MMDRILDTFMKKKNFYHLVYSNNCLHLYCYIHNVSADTSFGLLKGFLVELGSLHGTSNRTLYLIHVDRLFQFC